MPDNPGTTMAASGRPTALAFNGRFEHPHERCARDVIVSRFAQHNRGSVEMTTADWALIISILSAVVSLASFVWNVWSKFIYPKPAVHVSFTDIQVVSSDPTHGRQALCLQATNMGPAEVTLYAALLGQRRILQRHPRRLGLLQPLHNWPYQTNVSLGPFGNGLFPKKLNIGESFSVYFTRNHEGIAESNNTDIGFSDTFGRYHWAPRKDFQKIQRAIRAYRNDIHDKAVE
jgi:hypothetical protein